MNVRTAAGFMRRVIYTGLDLCGMDKYSGKWGMDSRKIFSRALRFSVANRSSGDRSSHRVVNYAGSEVIVNTNFFQGLSVR